MLDTELTATKLSISLLATINHEAGKPTRNVALSPTSVRTALMGLWLGAAGNTKQALGAALALPANGDSDQGQLPPMRRREGFKQAVSLWRNPEITLAPQYIADLEQHTGSSTHTLPQTEAAQQINTWIAVETNNKITKLLDQLPGATALVLVSAVHFVARWVTPFKHTDTRDDIFHLPDHRSVPVPFMQQTEHFAYSESTEYQWTRLPYKNSPIVMDLLLPYGSRDPVVFTADLLACGTNAKHTPGRAGTIRLPRFSLSWSGSLTPHLTELGLGEIFDLNRADFSRMSPSGGPIAISDARHSVTIQVDEDGTEAAAATALIAMRGGMPRRFDQPFNMVFDHPFLLAIRDIRDGEVLFLAAVRDPTQRG